MTRHSIYFCESWATFHPQIRLLQSLKNQNPGETVLFFSDGYKNELWRSLEVELPSFALLMLL